MAAVREVDAKERRIVDGKEREERACNMRRENRGRLEGHGATVWALRAVAASVTYAEHSGVARYHRRYLPPRQ